MAEVEAMLFASDCHEEAQDQVKENLISKVDFKGDRRGVGNVRRSLRICDLKSHSIARQSRKRLTHIKKRILKTLKGNMLEPADDPGIFNVCTTTTTTKIEAQSQSMESTLVKNPSLTGASTVLVENQLKKSSTSQQIKMFKSSSKPIISKVEILSPITNINSSMTLQSLLAESSISEVKPQKDKTERLLLENYDPKPTEPLRNKEQSSNTKIVQCYKPKKAQSHRATQAIKTELNSNCSDRESNDLGLLLSIGVS